MAADRSGDANVHESGLCECPCHRRGDPGDGYSFVWDDDRGIRHEDWVSCHCGCPKRGDGG